jgi:phosphatidylinositol alpha-1,6-mannosyltransferase
LKPLSILYVSHSFPLPDDPMSNVGGMQRVAVGLHDALAVHPEVRLHTRVLETSWRATPRRMPGYMAGLIRHIPADVARHGIDVVLFSSMVTATLSVVLRGRVARHGARLAAIPVGRDVTLPTPPYQWLVPRVFDALDLVFPISRATARECTLRGLQDAKMRIVPCGVDTAVFNPPADRAAARRALVESVGGGVADDALLLCSVGRHQERKGFQWFIDRVMPRLPADVVYLLSGDGPMTPQIRAAVERHGLGDRVRLLGQVPEDALRALYRGADLFVMPNVHVPGDIEGFGVVMLEAGMCGLPVLAADLEGIRDVVTEGANGTLVRSEDADAFAAAVLRYRAAPRAAEAVARHTAEHFSWSAIAGQYVRHLR